jgi:predicted RNA-binding Zn-ribbon protein involved in translation (DUF1610 family)
MFDDKGRAMLAAARGDRPLAERIIRDMADPDFARLRVQARTLFDLTEAEWAHRRRIRVAAMLDDAEECPFCDSVRIVRMAAAPGLPQQYACDVCKRGWQR